MKFSTSVIISALIFCSEATSAQSQSISTNLANDIAKLGIDKAQNLLDEGPDLLRYVLQIAELGQAFDRPENCRGGL